MRPNKVGAVAVRRLSIIYIYDDDAFNMSMKSFCYVWYNTDLFYYKSAA